MLSSSVLLKHSEEDDTKDSGEPDGYSEGLMISKCNNDSSGCRSCLHNLLGACSFV
jgi:hypothetical protein